MPKISVIMPVYNGESFIEQAIQSLLFQSFDDWELIVVDDGSTDSTPIILQKLNDIRINTIWQENRGEAGARNTALNHVTGEYLAFLDADDVSYWMPYDHAFRDMIPLPPDYKKISLENFGEEIKITSNDLHFTATTSVWI